MMMTHATACAFQNYSVGLVHSTSVNIVSLPDPLEKSRISIFPRGSGNETSVNNVIYS